MYTQFIVTLIWCARIVLATIFYFIVKPANSNLDCIETLIYNMDATD